jgi:ribosome recycling factor
VAKGAAATPTVVLGDGRRGLAKKAKGAGGGGKGKGKNVDDDSPGEPIDTRTILKEMGDDCINATNNLDSELSLLRTGRADPRILDKVRVEAYTTSVSLEKIAQTVVTDARTLTVTVFDPELVGAVDKAIRGAGLDLNPQIAGSTLRVPIPKVTQEGRKKLTKQAGSIAENAKVVIRRIRHHYMDTGKKLDLPKDDAKKYEKDVQEIHDKAVKDIDARVKTKQAQLLDD